MTNMLMNILVPLAGLGMPLWAVAMALLAKRGLGFFVFGTPVLNAFCTSVPTLAATGYWRSGFWLRLTLPLACMALFALHPVGSLAWVYSLYWLVPVAVYLSATQSLFAHALACTFIQHAVGSVIYLYCVPTAPALWYSLLPLVALERLVFASGMVAAVSVVQYCARIFVRRASTTRIYNS
jgi:hypothetical protein